jgi:hypothetical protein
MKRSLLTLLKCSALALIATTASSLWLGRVKTIIPGSTDCNEGCNLIAGGWPFFYLVDQPAFSPSGSISLVGGLLGVDTILPWSFVASLAVWLLLFIALHQLIDLLKRYLKSSNE